MSAADWIWNPDGDGITLLAPGSHGIPSRYNRGCRCAECTAAATARKADWAARNKDRAPRVHGISAYKHHGCRCEACRAAKRAENKRYRYGGAA